MNQPTTKALICACITLTLSGKGYCAEEEEESGFLDDISGSLLFSTNYMFRSISNSNNRPQVRGDLNWSHDSGIYLGVWSSNTDFGGEGNSMELDPYIGIARDIGETGFSFDLGYWYYYYPGSHSDLDYAEIYLTPSYTKGDFSISPSFWYSDNYFGEDFLDGVSSFAYEVTLGYDLPDDFKASARVGEQTFASDFSNLDYTYWDIGVIKTYGDFAFELRWFDNNGVDPFLASPKLTDKEVVFSVTRSF